MPMTTNASCAARRSKSAPGSRAISGQRWVPIRKHDGKRGIIYGMVYEPNVLDSQGEMMFAEDVEAAAHRFMKLDLARAIDTHHDNVPNDCYPVENFIARKGDPDYPEGSWVLGVKVTDAISRKVDAGEINGFSFDCMVRPQDVDVTYRVQRDNTGVTETAEDHVHVYALQVNDMGRVISGKTDVIDGHSHDILRASVTEHMAGHSHRFFL